MEQNKNVILAVVITTVVVVGVGAGGLFGYSQMHHKTVLNDGAASFSADSGGSTTQLGGSNQSDASGLNVNAGSSSAQSLGQLGGSTSTSSQGTQGGNTSQSSSGGSGTPTIDPSTFSQYEQYKDKTQALFGDVQAGTGATVGQTSKVAVYYKGWLTNGQMFDQSRTGSDGKLQPFTFTMGAHQVISGWEQGVYGMKVGGTRLIIVPPSVGYGATATGSIPANSLLVFEVQVLSVQ